jgi:hypothetical protein
MMLMYVSVLVNGTCIEYAKGITKYKCAQHESVALPGT